MSQADAVIYELVLSQLHTYVRCFILHTSGLGGLRVVTLEGGKNDRGVLFKEFSLED